MDRFTEVVIDPFYWVGGKIGGPRSVTWHTFGLRRAGRAMTMTRSEVVEALTHAPPWDGYSIDDPVLLSITDTVASLVYTGTGHRNDGDDFEAVMATTYVRHDAGWRLALYQQTPTG